jgi:uncharacterized membrane protein YfcA
MTFGLALALVLAILIGLALGMLGGGGAIVTLPVLVYVAGIPPQKAVGMSLAVVGATSLIGSGVQYLRGHFHVQATLLFALTGTIGAYFGAGLTHLLPPPVLMLLFASLMLVVGSIMLRGRRAAESKGECHPLRCLALGAVVGVLTGFLGVGGGFLIVPALVLFAGIDMTKAVGSSLAIIALNSVSGLMGQLQHTTLDWALTSGFLAVALIGMLIGLALAQRISQQTLRRLFAGFVIAVAGVLFITQVIALMRS